MKKVSALILMIVCSLLVIPANINNESHNRAQDDWQDRVELSRQGGTTRVARQSTFSIQSRVAPQPVAEPIVEVYSSNNELQVLVQNYSGLVWVEVYGSRGAKQASFQIYDTGFEVIELSGLGAGEYNVRITVGSDVFTGKFKKGQYGKR
jgi:hypothetical protein